MCTPRDKWKIICDCNWSITSSLKLMDDVDDTMVDGSSFHKLEVWQKNDPALRVVATCSIYEIE